MSIVQGPWSEAGLHLQSLRLHREITAGEMAEQANAPSRQWVLDIETGRRAVPSSMYNSLARILDIPVRDFAAMCLRYYDHQAYEALFGGQHDKVAVAA